MNNKEMTQLKICCENLLEVIELQTYVNDDKIRVVEISDIKTQINELVEVLYSEDEVSE